MPDSAIPERCGSCGAPREITVAGLDATRHHERCLGRSTPHRLTGTTRYERGIHGDERRDYGGPAGRYDQMVSDED